ncbi:alkaline phosphatase family protein [Sphaerisporangium sp. NPDC004334]
MPLCDGALRRVRPGTLASSFRADVEAGRLPEVSYIIPSAADSEHPSASSPVQSARITWDILDAIASTPEVWRSTALFITYDENDGFFDHVPPPRPPAERAEEYYDGKPIGLGVRVPMIVVSPWTVGGYVCSRRPAARGAQAGALAGQGGPRLVRRPGLLRGGPVVRPAPDGPHRERPSQHHRLSPAPRTVARSRRPAGTAGGHGRVRVAHLTPA